MLKAGLGGASIFLLAEESPGGSALLGSAPSVLTPGGARCPAPELNWALWGRGREAGKTSQHHPHLLLLNIQYASLRSCPRGKDSRNCTISQCPFILALPLTCSLGARQNAGQFELIVDKICGQKPSVQSTERALPEGKGLEPPTGAQLPFPQPF